MNKHELAPIVPALERATHAVAGWGEHALSNMSLTQAEVHVLGYLARAGTCAINDLHKSFGHKRSTLTSILDRMEEHGLVQRRPHPLSRRSILVVPTDEGRVMADRVGNALRALEADIRRRVDADDLAAFLRVIAAIEESVK